VNVHRPFRDTIRAFRAGRHGIVYGAPRRIGRREIALTFDDGPSEWTPAILDVLAEHGARGTFFVLGASVAGREETVRRMAAEAHELGNHAFSHADPETLSDEALRAELERTGSLIEDLVGERPRHFRPPYAGSDFRVADVARAAGFDRTVLRSIDPADWDESEPDAILERVVREARPGAIVCLHDGVSPGEDPSAGRQPTVDAVARLVPELHERGYELVTVTELLTWRRR
jgi:peptidoglycan/xylan/chitin deacetylase (PgdA/CDA1 family)